MEFQVFSVCIEDKYPLGLPFGMRREALLYNGFQEEVKGVNVEKEKSGCVAFVFGRSSIGQSVCVRVEGVRPKLYIKGLEGDTALQVGSELTKEVRECLSFAEIVQVQKKHFAHDYGYEFDAASPSKRMVHVYWEVSYPSLSSWRFACKLRKEQLLQKVRQQIKETNSELATVVGRMAEIRKIGVGTGGAGLHRLEYKAVEQRENHLRLCVLPGLVKRENVLRDNSNKEDRLQKIEIDSLQTKSEISESR